MIRGSAVILFLLLFFCQSFAQGQVARPAWRSIAAVGYWHGSSDLNDYYASVLDHYRELGIPIPLQRGFGRTVFIDAGVLYSTIASLQIGFSAGVRYTPASAGYEDFAGILRIDGSMYSYSLSLVMIHELAKIGGLPFLLTFEPGVAYSTVAITKELQFTGRPQFNEQGEWRGSAWGYHFRILLGTSVPLGPFTAGLHAGYQKGIGRVGNGTATGTGWMIAGGVPPFLNQEGPVMLLRLGYVL